MKSFMLGLVLGLSLAALPLFAEQRGIFFNPSNPMVPETWSQKQTREALENPMDQYGNSYSNSGGSLMPNFSEGSRRGPC